MFEYSAGGILVQPGIYEVVADFHAVVNQSDTCSYSIVTADADTPKEVTMVNSCPPVTIQERKQACAIIKVDTITRVLIKFSSESGISWVPKSTESSGNKITIKRL